MAMKRDLWLRLKDYHFAELVPTQLLDHVAGMFGGTDPSTNAFASKLSRKLGWSMPFAQRAIDEYKKFVYLGSVGDVSVTPSKVIDQVWHEHLLFSRAYRQFCREVLGRDFDHNPELVPMDGQTDVFHAQYLETLEAYRTEFNVEPPADIWSVPKFKAPGVVTVNTLQKVRRRADRGADDTPLHIYFTSGDAGGHPHSHSHASLDYPEFGGSGGVGGGGGARDWGDNGHAHGDSTSHGDSSGSAGDGGSSCSSGSGCSSSCGGGGGCSSD